MCGFTGNFDSPGSHSTHDMTDDDFVPSLSMVSYARFGRGFCSRHPSTKIVWLACFLEFFILLASDIEYTFVIWSIILFVWSRNFIFKKINGQLKQKKTKNKELSLYCAHHNFSCVSTPRYTMDDWERHWCLVSAPWGVIDFDLSEATQHDQNRWRLVATSQTYLNVHEI